MAPVCRDFGISRVTGYKIFNRYKECGRATRNRTADTNAPDPQERSHKASIMQFSAATTML